MGEHINRGCTNHGCVYHYVYPELANGMHTNGPCHCKARPIADYLYRQNAQLKAELDNMRRDKFTMERNTCEIVNALYRDIDKLKAECEQWKVVDKKKLHNKITKLEKERDDLLSNL